MISRSWLFTTSLVLAVGVLGRSGLSFEENCKASIRCLDYFATVDPHARQYSSIVKALLQTTTELVKKRERSLRSQRKQASSQLFGLLPLDTARRSSSPQPQQAVPAVPSLPSASLDEVTQSTDQPLDWTIYDADFFARHFLRAEFGQKHAVVIVPVVRVIRNKRVNCVAVSVNRRFAHRAVFVLPIVRLDVRFRAALNRFVKSVIGAFDMKSDVAHAVAVGEHVLGHRRVGRERASHEKPDAALLEHVRNSIAPPGLRAGVADLLEAEGRREQGGEGSGVAHPPLHMVEGTGRYVLAAFPVIAAAGDYLATRKQRWVRPVALSLLGLGLIAATAAFSMGVAVS